MIEMGCYLIIKKWTLCYAGSGGILTFAMLSKVSLYCQIGNMGFLLYGKRAGRNIMIFSLLTHNHIVLFSLFIFVSL